MRLCVTAFAILALASLAWADQDADDKPMASKCVVVYTDAFRYDASTLPQQKADTSLWKRTTVAVCWYKGQEHYMVIAGEHLFREYIDKGKTVREGVGGWQFAPRVYLHKAIGDDVKEWEGGLGVMLNRSPFDDPYKED